ncbi:N,N-dimethylformamidase beta subunit family domain-containing protein, partial [Salinibacter ruber]
QRRDGDASSSHTIFVVRRQGPSDVLVQTSEMTMHAYNRYGGNSLYFGQPVGRSFKVSYNRPFGEGDGVDNDFFNAEYPLVRFLERNGYDVAYCGGIDVHRDASVLQGRKIFVSSGHDEYVTGAQRTNVTAARDAGTHLIFMTGNEYFWRVRTAPSIDGASTPDRTIVCYKETLDGAKTDPSSEWT